MKICTKCQVTQDEACFSKDRNRRDNLFPHCKSCVKAYRQSDRGSKLQMGAGKPPEEILCFIKGSCTKYPKE